MNTPEGERRSRARNTEYDEIITELGYMRAELSEVRGLVRKLHRALVVRRIITAIKWVLFIALLLGLASIVSQYLPLVTERISVLRAQFEEISNVQEQLQIFPKMKK